MTRRAVATPRAPGRRSWLGLGSGMSPSRSFEPADGVDSPALHVESDPAQRPKLARRARHAFAGDDVEAAVVAMTGQGFASIRRARPVGDRAREVRALLLERHELTVLSTDEEGR